MGALTPVGIEKIRAYPSTLSLDMSLLARARGVDPRQVRDEMMIDERSVCPAWEDPVTLAVNCALPMLTEDEKQSIELLLVATESSVDQEKPLSTWVQRYLGLPDRCRNLEVKHACYGGTGALHLAAAWVRTQIAPGKRALVVTTDLSRMHFHKPYEMVMGTGAVAMLVSDRPRFFAIDDGLSGVYTYEVSDLTRPTSRVEAGHEETSLLSYIDAVDITFDRYRDSVESRLGLRLDSLESLRAFLPHAIYHAPFGGITFRAHKAVLRALGTSDTKLARADYEERVLPSLRHNRRMGGTYAASTFISLLGIADRMRERGWPSSDESRRVGIYSYGSGSCAELYSGVLGPEADAIAAAADLDGLVQGRVPLSVREYEEAERERSCFIDCGDYRTSLDGSSGAYDAFYRGKGRLVFRGMTDFVRQYEWS